MKWILPEYDVENDNLILSEIEGKTIERIKIEIEGSNNYEISKISGNFPQGIELIKDDRYYYIQGTLDYVPETTSYYFTLQAKDLNTNEKSEHWYSIEVVTLNTEWIGYVYKCIKNQPSIMINNWQTNTEYQENDLVIYNDLIYKCIITHTSEDIFNISNWKIKCLNEEYWKPCDIFDDNWEEINNWQANTEYQEDDLVIYNYFEMFEKYFFQYQYNLINPEGNEVFKKIAGEIPVGLTLSETGLLYGVPEEYREKEYIFRIGVYRNDKLIYQTSDLKIKVKNINELIKPIWITDAGILDYVEYNVKKDLQVVAYDFSGHKIFYEMVSENLPNDIDWRTIENDSGKYGEDVSERTGKFYGKCLTKVTKDDWYITLKPYIIVDNNKIYGDERTFYIVTNAIEENNLIHWETETLDDAKIGYIYNTKIVATSSSKVFFELSSGNLPKGLYFNKNGEIYGTTDFQDLGVYDIYVKAYTLKTFEIKKFSINVIKGFSKNTLDVYLYINKEYQEDYYNILTNFDRTSGYRTNNILYKTPSTPTIYIGTLNAYDKVLLKHKLGNFNTPIEIFMKEIKKKALDDYDLFYKDFNEVNKESDFYTLMKHTDTDTTEINNYGNDYFPGYIRNKIINEDVTFKDLDGNIIAESVKNDDGTYHYETSSGDKVQVLSKVSDKISAEYNKYIYFTYNENDVITWIYVDVSQNSEGIVVKPYYTPENAYDNAKFGKPYVYLNNDNKKVYVRQVPKDTYYEKESKRILKFDEPIYIKITTLLTGEKILYKYVIVKENNTEVEKEVDILTEPTYVRYNPNSSYDAEQGIFEDNDEYIIDAKEYNKIEYENNEQEYYVFNSPMISFQTSSINEIRNKLNEKINVEKLEGKVLYKVGNQEIVNLDDVRYIYDITTNEDGSYTAKLSNETRKEVFYVYTKIDENTYKQVFAKVGDKYRPLIQKQIMLDNNPDYVYYTFYKKGSNIPFNNALFRFDDGRKIYVNNNEWFLLNEIENPYVYYAENNSLYGYDKDIVLPFIQDEHVENGIVQFLDIDKEKDYLPEYMVDTTYSKWKTNTDYFKYDKVVYNGYIYDCLENHTSGEIFDESKWKKIRSVKRYEAIIPIFYAVSHSHDTTLKSINTYEKMGHNWYGRKFIFYEIHFEPRYENDDIFTIDFYNHINENTPEFQLI